MCWGGRGVESKGSLLREGDFFHSYLGASGAPGLEGFSRASHPASFSSLFLNSLRHGKLSTSLATCLIASCFLIWSPEWPFFLGTRALRPLGVLTPQPRKPHRMWRQKVGLKSASPGPYPSSWPQIFWPLCNVCGKVLRGWGADG